MKYGKSSIVAIAIFVSSGALIAAAGGKVDSNGDGIVTKAEADAAAQARFAKMDINGDGVLNKADGDARAKARFAKMDANGDGVLSEEEFLAVREARLEKREERKAKRKDRKAKRAEKGNKRAGKKRGGRKGRVVRLLKRADSNNDQSISRDEFIAFSDTRFAKVDSNSDGQITKEERKANHQARRNQRRNSQ